MLEILESQNRECWSTDRTGIEQGGANNKTEENWLNRTKFTLFLKVNPKGNTQTLSDLPQWFNTFLIKEILLFCTMLFICLKKREKRKKMHFLLWAWFYSKNLVLQTQNYSYFFMLFKYFSLFYMEELLTRDLVELNSQVPQVPLIEMIQHLGGKFP